MPNKTCIWSSSDFIPPSDLSSALLTRQSQPCTWFLFLDGAAFVWSASMTLFCIPHLQQWEMFFLWSLADLLPLHSVLLLPLIFPLGSVFSSDSYDPGLVDVYDNQCHVWVPGIQPGAPVTQLLWVLVGPRMYRYSCSSLLSWGLTGVPSRLLIR